MRASVVSAPTAVVSTTSSPSALIEPPVTPAAGRLLHGQALAGEHALVHAAAALATRPSTGMRSPGPDDHDVADPHLGERHLDLGAAAAQARRVGPQRP